MHHTESGGSRNNNIREKDDNRNYHYKRNYENDDQRHQLPPLANNSSRDTKMMDGGEGSPFRAYLGGNNSRGPRNRSRDQLPDRYYGESDEKRRDKYRRDARKQNKNGDRYYCDDDNRRRANEDFKTDRYRNRSHRSNDYHSYDHDSCDSNRREELHRYRSSSRHLDKMTRREDFSGERSPSPHIRHRNESDKATEESNTQRKAEEWPPSFEDDGGSAFVFDVRSAMFYEPLSDFFYDPKSKLYYGNKKRAYFRFDEKNDPPFAEVQKMTTEELERREDGGETFQEMDRKMDVRNKQLSSFSKPKIAIKLKTKKVKSSTSVNVAAMESSDQSASTTISKAKKQQIANIEKWTELKQSGATTATATDNSSGDKVPKTKSGEPICIICKRKFPNLAKLRLHEKASDLHKQNLLKLQKKQKDGGKKRKIEGNMTTTDDETAALAPAYTDRAEKRRQLHGSDLSATPNGISSFRRDANDSKVESSGLCGDHIKNTSGLDPLGETNVGHQMLQRMGWKGSISSDKKETDDCRSKAKTTNDHLRKDWDHIEAVAAKNNLPRYRSKF